MRLGRQLLPLGVLLLITLVGLALFADADELLEQLRGFDPALLPALLGLSLVNYLVRFVRWQIYLRHLGVRLAWHKSLAVFLFGFVLSVTPGKAGELGKAWLVRELGGGPAMRVAPAVVCERLTDLLGVIAIILLGVSAMPRTGVLAAASLVVIVVGWWVRTRRGAVAWLLRRARRWRRLRGWLRPLIEGHRSLQELLAPRLLLSALVLALYIPWRRLYLRLSDPVAASRARHVLARATVPRPQPGFLARQAADNRGRASPPTESCADAPSISPCAPPAR